MADTTHTLRLIDEYLTQGGYAPNIDPETLESETPLIAAAPDLLEALEKVQDWLSGCSTRQTVQQYVTSAIAKATGQ